MLFVTYTEGVHDAPASETQLLRANMIVDAADTDLHQKPTLLSYKSTDHELALVPRIALQKH